MSNITDISHVEKFAVAKTRGRSLDSLLTELAGVQRIELLHTLPRAEYYPI